jgi:hypothetical protein
LMRLGTSVAFEQNLPGPHLSRQRRREGHTFLAELVAWSGWRVQ